jgi:uncharacterized protein (DUF1499 family)
MLGWLMGLVFPACAAAGAGGLPPPRPIDFATLARPATPNTALAAPAESTPIVPDIALAPLSRPPEHVRDAVLAAATADSVFDHGATGDQLHWVARSSLFNFPDLITAEITADGNGTRLILWSRSVYGRSDFGQNRKRLARWITTIEGVLAR